VDYEIDDDPSRVDVDAVWSFLSQEAYWGRWRSRADFEKQLSSAWRVVGCYHRTDGLVGFARAISDGVALAYLADVFVTTGHRGKGLARRIVTTMVEEGPGARFRWLLHTADAHDLYRQLGFAAPDHTFMERAAKL